MQVKPQLRSNESRVSSGYWRLLEAPLESVPIDHVELRPSQFSLILICKLSHIYALTSCEFPLGTGGC